ncbi:MAG TPA: DUF1592 domain-containing protein [Candidatus Limnocylindria bacterium]|jgi:hypothetical protein|nr:DUF1592 domain-containing protein [Candidatus Limnocylindria bacterium]
MRRQIIILSVLLAGAIASGWFALARKGSGPRTSARRTVKVDLAKADAQFHQEVQPLLSQYCWDCHGDGATKGDLSLDSFTNVTAVLKDRRTWEHVLQNVESGDMPPKKKKSQPSLAEREKITAWIQKTLFPIDPEHPDPGRVTLHRLNREEYNNTVRDLVGIDFKPADDFPRDDVGYGFDNNGDVLSLPPMLFEKYLRAAERIMDEAVVSGPRPPPLRHFEAKQLEGGVDVGEVRGLASNGELSIPYHFPLPGKYVLRIRAYGQQAGPDPVKMAVRLDGKDVQQFDVKAKAADPGTYEAEVKIESAGQKVVAAAFLNDFYNVKAIEHQREGKAPRKEKVVEDRNFYCNFIEVSGPIGTELPLPESHRRIFTREADGKNDGLVARELIGNFTRKAWRRPVKPDETDRLMKLFYEAQVNGDNFPAAVKHALTAVLVSPHFLFRNELQPDPNNAAVVSDIDEYALASRLSYFLWSSMPDEELFRLAGTGKLRRNLDAQVSRMLRDPKAQALTENFAGQWLQLRMLALVDPDHDKYPDFNEDMRRDMRTETEKFFEYIITADRPVSDFLTADYTFINERLAKH